MLAEASSITKMQNELLNKIFGYINDERLIRRSICKSWFDATGGEITRFACSEDSMIEFGDYLHNHPNFQRKVLSLKVKKGNAGHTGSSPATFLPCLLAQMW